MTEVLPILYLRGLSTGDFQAAAAPSCYNHAADGELEMEYRAWRRRDLHHYQDGVLGTVDTNESLSMTTALASSPMLTLLSVDSIE